MMENDALSREYLGFIWDPKPTKFNLFYYNLNFLSQNVFTVKCTAHHGGEVERDERITRKTPVDS